MRIRNLRLYKRLFHDTNEECELNIKIYGTEKELENIQKIITVAVIENA